MGSCVSKKAARAGAGREGNNKVAGALPPVKDINALSPVAEEEEEEVEEVKEVVLSETPAPRPPLESPVKKRQELAEDEVGSGSERASVAKEKAMAMAKLGGEPEVVKRAVVDAAPEKARASKRTASPSRAPRPEERESKPKPNKQDSNNGRARSPSPRRQQQPVPIPPRREPAVVSAFGCRSGRFSPSAAVRRSQSAREADMALSAKRSLLNASVVNRRGDPGERSGRRSDSPTTMASKRPSPSPSPVHRQAASATTRRAAARENNLSGGRPERSRPRVVGPDDDAGRGGDEQPVFAGGTAGGEQKKPELGQNPSVAMECFIFL